MDDKPAVAASTTADARSGQRPFRQALERLQGAGLRPTRQRIALARLLFDAPHHHVTAEQLHAEAMGSDIKVSLATVYNTLNQFTDVGLLREVVVESGKSYFDTNTNAHHHFFIEATGSLIDIPVQELSFDQLPVAPTGMQVTGIDVVIRLIAGKQG